MSDYYRLDENKNAIPCSLLEWAEQLEDMSKNDNKHVKCEMVGDHMISTVWLGLNHGVPLAGKAPLIFETMIFKDETMQEIFVDRYSTWKQAEEGHQKAVEWVKNGCKDE